MDDIKVGEYVKTNKGEICKVLGINKEIRNGNRIYSHKSYNLDNRKGSLTRAFIKSHSLKIKKLIEVGDIIEWEWKEFGYYGINEVINRFGTIGVYPEEYDEVISLKDIKIKSILTHEQYERDCYKLEEE